MKTVIKLFSLFSILFLLTNFTYSNGVAVYNASLGMYLKLLSGKVSVSVESQISVTKTTGEFINLSGSDRNVSFAFPLPEGASATELRWKINGIWYQAPISPQPQDTTLPGGTMSPNLKTYLGKTPLFFGIEQTVKRDSILIVELTYVQLLKYDFGSVDFDYPNDYRLIQNSILNVQELVLNLNSQRSIDSIKLISSNPLIQISNNGNNAVVVSRVFESIASVNYKIRYSLNQNQLGLYGYSSRIPNSLLPDTLGGFFLFLAEPDPGMTSQTIKKVFTLIIDKSGSMSGNKIVQAKNASSFVVNNLNSGDRFNLVTFESTVQSFRNTHIPYNSNARDSALTFINSIIASGGTNISGAFETAVPQFSIANDSTANIIVFFTDGQPTVGITAISQLVTHIKNLIVTSERKIFLYSFGIGSDVNAQLLTLISSQNNGYAEFLGEDEIYDRISKFYLRIRNPVLLSPTISFNNPTINNVHPNPLPNLYKGQQMIVSGRYRNSGVTNVTFSGYAFNQLVNFNYNLNLTDTNDVRYQFLTKIWAKQKIDYLLIQYYSYPPTSPEAIALKQQIISLSITYGVISPFTSFGNPTNTETEEEIVNTSPESFKLLGNYPNPFNPTTNIRFAVNTNYSGILFIRIYNTAGMLVDILEMRVNGKGNYEVKWDASKYASGLYFYSIDFLGNKFSGKMMLVK
ncbi:MAG: VWA domain-containing protein [Ignavibacteria bacterium]|nr:VWA domain-containing protein [Ignavibacteria bacterium]